MLLHGIRVLLSLEVGRDSSAVTAIQLLVHALPQIPVFWPMPFYLLKSLLTVQGAVQIISRLSHLHSNLYKENWTPHHMPCAARLGHIFHYCCLQSY